MMTGSLFDFSSNITKCGRDPLDVTILVSLPLAHYLLNIARLQRNDSTESATVTNLQASILDNGILLMSSELHIESVST